MRPAIPIAILVLVSYGSAVGQVSTTGQPTRRLYARVGYPMGYMMARTKIAHAQEFNFHAALCYKIKEDLRMEVGLASDLLYSVLKDRKDIRTYVDPLSVQPDGVYAGPTFAMTRLHPGDWYTSIGFSQQHLMRRSDPTSYTLAYHDSTVDITVKGKRVPAFFAPYIELGIYSSYNARTRRPSIAGVGFHATIRYTYTPTLYRGAYYESINGNVKEGTVLIAGGHLSVGLNFMIGRPVSKHKNKNKKKRNEPKLDQKFQMKDV